MADSTLHMLQLELDARGVWRGAEKHGLQKQTTDLGYLVHAHLAELFGDRAPKPFRVTERRDRLDILAYGAHDAGALREHAETFVEPLAWDTCRALASKPMPVDFEAGRRLGFEVLTCPVARMAKAFEKKDFTRRAGAEIDVYLRAAELAEDDEKPPERHRVYLDWLAGQLEAGGARLVDGELARFHLVRLVRKRQGEGRKAKSVQRPSALMRGVLEVTDPRAFSQLLPRGVGRHRAFGFGMILLRPS